MFLILCLSWFAADMEANQPIQSISVLEFMDDGTLLIGDSIGGQVIAVDLGEQNDGSEVNRLSVPDLESKLAQMLGTQPADVLIHDMAVHPGSREVYLAVSRSRAKWNSRWELPNHLANSTTLLKMTPEGEFSEVNLKTLKQSSVSLKSPIDAAKEHRWMKGLSQRVEAITDITFSEGNIYVAGLSNEEFSSSIWKVGYPLKESAAATSIEIFHGAHGKYETHSPIRTFVPYTLNNKEHLLAAYLCTPFVTIEVDDLKPAAKIKGRTVAEFGSGNYPLDMVVIDSSDGPQIMISNSNLPIMFVNPKDIESFKGEITEQPKTYAAGVKTEYHSGTGILHLDNLSPKSVVMIQRLPSGKLDLVSIAFQ